MQYNTMNQIQKYSIVAYLTQWYLITTIYNWQSHQMSAVQFSASPWHEKDKSDIRNSLHNFTLFCKIPV